MSTSPMDDTSQMPPESIDDSSSPTRPKTSSAGVILGKIVITGYIYSNSNGSATDSPYIQLRQPDPSDNNKFVYFNIWSNPRVRETSAVPGSNGLAGVLVPPELFDYILDLSRQKLLLTLWYSYELETDNLTLSISHSTTNV